MLAIILLRKTYAGEYAFAWYQQTVFTGHSLSSLKEARLIAKKYGAVCVNF